MKKFLCKEIVTAILEAVPASRESDHVLFAEYIRSYCPGLAPCLRDQIAEVLSDRSGYSFESLRRSRQLIQNKRPELRPPERVSAYRRAQEAQIKEEIERE